ncbi:sigma-54 dependent transcriptional regulator [Aquiflexum sp. TKW24L]|uniref:sigma-54-dependent transcriptional regulator n=1 Tax=Aquiflexum sp. TKW24L TaxID=2942212 RepID=UPI0020C0E597|nr:sigma-54 dependent transcriptional regulator [Aquiflexum sp. TKW24L]MCL6261564.1 sigma-54 dependent transcriptional regulator [Aquiflexum sp. TKW24L]
MKSILIIDNHVSTCTLLHKFLTKHKYIVETTTDAIHGLEILKKNKFDLLIVEYHLPDFSGMEMFDRIQKIDPEAGIIFMSGQVTLKNAVNIIQRGALNFISKPLNPDELLDAIKDAQQEKINMRSEKSTSKPICLNHEPTPDTGLVWGKCSKAVDMMHQVKTVGATNYSVIIQGETGTGKESLARLIHSYSPRRDKPFIAVDCGSLSKEIASSELFGHEKGSFTGAHSQKTGFFEQANGGTIFLDEIANLSLDIQMALLRALQEKVIRKIGGNREIFTDVRIITATNEDLLEKSETSLFREDLYFRLSEYVLEVPALRDRMEDLSLFIDFFLEQTSVELNIPKPRISSEVKSCFEAYSWPGNLRELKNVIRGVCLFLGEENMIEKESLPSRIINCFENPLEKLMPIKHDELMETAFEELKTTDLKSTALKAEYKRILEVMNKVHFNKTKAAQILNIHRKTLYSKLRLMNIPY